MEKKTWRRRRSLNSAAVFFPLNVTEDIIHPPSHAASSETSNNEIFNLSHQQVFASTEVLNCLTVNASGKMMSPPEVITGWAASNSPTHTHTYTYAQTHQVLPAMLIQREQAETSGSQIPTDAWRWGERLQLLMLSMWWIVSIKE